MDRCLTTSLRTWVVAFCAIALGSLAAFASPAQADQADVEAAARGVVRIVIIKQSGEELQPTSHGTGFAISPTKIVTNAHVIREALLDDTLRIGIVPSSGSNSAFVKPIAVSPRNDLALVEIVDSNLRLPPLTIAGGLSSDMSEVSAVGYPMNVDLAQGLEIGDILQSQPPVKSRGFLSGERPSRQFDTILHTASIARGNSGGPLLDGCGRVLGVNSFGADSDGSDAEFYFAVSLRELLPFLRANDIEPQTNALPCRSIDELDAAERARFDAQRAEARARVEAREDALREAKADARMAAQLQVMEERDNAMAMALILLIVGIAGGYAAHQLRNNYRADPEANASSQTRAMIAAGIAGVGIIGTILVWVTRPGYDEIEDRAAAALEELQGEGSDDGQQISLAGDGTLICTFVTERSRVIGARKDDVEFDWAADGCVNSRTQYGTNNGNWTRVFVPDDEEAVSVNTYDPEARVFRTDRYLLGRDAMEAARTVRSAYDPPACGVTDAARILGEQQSGVIAQLPDRPNERLVYTCEAKPSTNTLTAEVEE